MQVRRPPPQTTDDRSSLNAKATQTGPYAARARRWALVGTSRSSVVGRRDVSRRRSATSRRWALIPLLLTAILCMPAPGSCAAQARQNAVGPASSSAHVTTLSQEPNGAHSGNPGSNRAGPETEVVLLLLLGVLVNSVAMPLRLLRLFIRWLGDSSSYTSTGAQQGSAAGANTDPAGVPRKANHRASAEVRPHPKPGR